MRRLRYFLLILILSFALAGCSIGEPSIKLTEDESNAIAQYCAHLIMKYGAKELYYEKLLDEKDFKDKLEEREALLNPSPTPEPSQEPTPTPEPEPDITDAPDNNGGDNGEPGGTDVTPEPSTVLRDASELFDPSVFEVSVTDIVFTKNYKSDLEYFTLSAPAGKLVAAFTIEVKNIASQNKVFDYNNYDVQFQFVADSKTSSAPEISLLSNDFRFTRSEIKPGEVFSGVVVFFIDENCKNYTFRILGDSKAYELNNSTEVENGN